MAAREEARSGAGTGPSSVARRAAAQSLADRQSAYAEEVQRLLDAGLALMRERGTTSSPRVADIVAAAKLSNDAFYRHFAGKDELVAAIVEAGYERLEGYLRHHVERAVEPTDQVRAFMAGVMRQASDPEVADATRAVLWNGGQTAGRSRTHGSTTYDRLTALLLAPLADLGSSDPERDAAVITQATMGRMTEFLWMSRQPTPDDVEHLIQFCLAGVLARPT